ncbi:MAG: hypothetical protein M1407_00520 [Deltaproteobacteria bacterium]|nr:hypothetical protein [Deltaproteobacteria bacterium]
MSDKVIIPDNCKAELTGHRKNLLYGEDFIFQPIESQQSQQEDKLLNETYPGLLYVWTEAFHTGYNRGLFNKYLE